MIRRTLTPTLAALTLAAALAGCTGGTGGSGGESGSGPEDTAVKFMTAYAAGDDATMCDLADHKVGDCTTSPSVEVKDAPKAAGTFENEETGSTAVVVTYTTEERPQEPDSYVVEVKEDGKVTKWEDMSGQPKNRETVVMELGWSE